MFLKKEITLALLLCSVSFCHAQNKKIAANNENMQALGEMQGTAENYWLNSNIRTTIFKGPVSAITLVNADLKITGRDSVIVTRAYDSTVFKFDRQGREIAYEHYPNGPNTKVYVERKTAYDNAGKLESKQEDSYWGKYHGTYHYEYNAAGKMTLEIYRGTKGSIMQNKFIYDNAGWLAKKVTVNGENDTNYVVTYTYTPKGEKKSFGKIGFRKKTKSMRYEYDKQGRLTMIIDTVFIDNTVEDNRPYADTLVQNHKYKYDKNDNIIGEEQTGTYITWQRREVAVSSSRSTAVAVERQQTDSEDMVAPPKQYEYYKTPGTGTGSGITNVKYDYDRQNNLTHIELEHNNVKTVSEFRYVYDSQNNWISIRYFRNGQPSRELRRKIEYYE